MQDPHFNTREEVRESFFVIDQAGNSYEIRPVQEVCESVTAEMRELRRGAISFTCVMTIDCFPEAFPVERISDDRYKIHLPNGPVDVALKA